MLDNTIQEAESGARERQWEVVYKVYLKPEDYRELRKK
jgi:hypothetical protein